MTIKAQTDEGPGPQWPACFPCGEVAYPGKFCMATRCPWQRNAADWGFILGLPCPGAGDGRHTFTINTPGTTCDTCGVEYFDIKPAKEARDGRS